MAMRANVVDLSPDVQQIIACAELGEVVVLERDGLPVAEIRPVNYPTQRLVSAERLALLKELFPEPMMDSGRILEEDR